MKPDRDAFERVLRRSLGPPDVQADAFCLDAETFAAWADGGLRGSELTSAEAHLASCPRCQAMAAAFGRAIPEPPPPRPWWARPWTIGWLVPATAGVAAIAFWVATPQNRPADQVVVTQASSSTPQEPRQSASVDRQQERLTARGEPAGSFAPPIEGRQEAARPPAPAPRRADAKEEAMAGARMKSADAATPTDAAAGARSAPAAPELAPGRQLQAFAERAPALTIPTPDSKVIWRVSNGAGVLRSVDGGATWENIQTGVSGRFTAGSAPAATVCWLVGPQGLIIQTTDGRTWQRVPFVDASDLTAVQSVDARTARVTTTDGRTFRTADRGATWELVPLQEF